MKKVSFIFAFALLLSSCSVTHETKTEGKMIIITADTTVVYHGGNGSSHVTIPHIK